MTADQHPYFNIIATCLVVSTVAVVAVLALAAWLLAEKARAAACDRRAARAHEIRNLPLYAAADTVLTQPADLGPINLGGAHNHDGRWN